MNNRIATYRLTISFLSYWFVSTGNEQGAYADQLALKDSEGFPYIPGKTIKGVFREAFRLAGNSGWFSDSENEIPLNWYGQFISNNKNLLDESYLENEDQYRKRVCILLKIFNGSIL